MQHQLVESVSSAEPTDDRRSVALWRHPLTAPAAAALAVLVYCGLRLFKEPRFFFWDDTQLGAFGQWYGLGSRILAGELTIMSPGAWQGGNYLAEGQWGLWNPLTWLVALGTHVVPGATAYATAIKIAFLLVLCLGVYLVAREYGATRWWAALAGFSSTVGGQTVFMDAPSWVTGLQNVALFAMSWWALKRHVDRGLSPFPFLGFAYLLVTFGYIFGVIELAMLLIATLVDSVIRRAPVKALRVLILGVFAALLTVFVYLPGILTSPVTSRSGSEIQNDQFLNMDLGDLATSPIVTAVSSVRGYWGDLLPVPLQYVTWLLPLLVIVGRAGWRPLRSIAIPLALLALTVAFIIGPSVIGPLRYPARMMPYVVVAVVIVFAVIASRGWPREVSSRRLWLAVALTAGSGWLAWAAQPDSWWWVAVATALQIVLIVIATRWRRLTSVGAGQVAVPAFLLIASLVALAPQVDRYPSSPLGNFNVPSSVALMRDVAADMDPGIMTVGDVYSLQSNPESYGESLIANLWYLTEKDAASVYTVLPFTTFANALCLDLRGATCPAAFDELFRDSDQPLADDMALNTVVVIKGPGLRSIPDVPTGWSIQEGEYTWTLRRDTPVDSAGGVVRATSGTDVTTIARDDTSVTLRIDAAPTSGGSVVFSRLAWPGYSSTGGRLDSPERGFLLALAVDQSDVGETIVVTFRPPGWTVEVIAASSAALLAIAWTLLYRKVDRSIGRRYRRPA
ncbi:hypothetical protein V6S02_03005 [Microbacterium sp. CCNWLW134]|uniref:hypothetical protein n=1 Tax=Microbacterium sp. CCNWLW134 TaxID=3122064 RepID=UPI0030105BE2